MRHAEVHHWSALTHVEVRLHRCKCRRHIRDRLRGQRRVAVQRVEYTLDGRCCNVAGAGFCGVREQWNELQRKN